jgi:hypothetical protein
MLKKEAVLNFDSEITEIKEKFGCEEWVTAFLLNEDAKSSDTIYCALIPESRSEEVLGDPSWNFHMGDGLPQYVTSYQEGKEETKYYRFSYDSVEPLVILRTFHGIKENYWEISEEFRHYFNLYEDRKKGRFIEIDYNGDETEVAIIEKESIRIKSSNIKEFLAVKKACLLIQYEFNRFSPKSLEEQGIKELDVTIKEDKYCYTQYIRDFDFIDDDTKSHARLFGVKLIQGFPEIKPRGLFRQDKKYEDFFIGFNEKGEDVNFTCEEKKLSNFFGANKGAPNYLTPVFFSKDVLAKYYAQPSKYSVHDGSVSCAGLWILPIDNNHPDHVIVFLGDLGKLQNKEQLYWKYYNLKTKGKMSYVAWTRAFKAEFTDPEKSDLFFKHRYPVVQKNWKEKMGWELFLPLSTDDEYHFKSLRIPLTNEQREFDEQVLSLTKLLVDSLNEKELTRGLPPLKPNSKGITKLEFFLENKGFRFKEMIKFLRDLQDLRSSGVAHLKGSEYDRMKAEFSIGEKELSEVFDGILVKAIKMLNTLDFSVLKTDRKKYGLK